MLRICQRRGSYCSRMFAFTIIMSLKCVNSCFIWAISYFLIVSWFWTRFCLRTKDCIRTESHSIRFDPYFVICRSHFIRFVSDIILFFYHFIRFVSHLNRCYPLWIKPNSLFANFVWPNPHFIEKEPHFIRYFSAFSWSLFFFVFF